MKIKIILLSFILALCYPFQSKAQWSTKSFTFGGLTRQYMIYIPADYNVSTPASVVVTLHGLGDTMNNFSQVGFNNIADTANFIVLVPQAISDQLVGTAWNSGAGEYGYYPNSSVDDIGFLNAMVDTTIAHYSVNQQRIYMCGFSMGGFMTERMACQANTKYAAFASVSGTIGSELTLASCNPSRAVPIAHFHGTSDSTVGYYNDAYGINVDSLIHFWIANNGCDTTPIITSFPNTANDSLTVDHIVYPNGNNGTDVELFRVNGGVHQWLYKPLNDINYTVQIWKFFSQYQRTLSINENSKNTNITIYPNPAKDELHIKLPKNNLNQPYQINLYDMKGNLVYQSQSSSQSFNISLKSKSISRGTYLLRLKNADFNFSQKVILDK